MEFYARAPRAWKLLFVVSVSCLLALPSLSVATPSSTPHAYGNMFDGGGYRFTRTERCLMRRINGIRSSHGLRRLEGDKQLAYVARQHAKTMASARGVWHDPNVSSEVTRWRRLGQNTGRGRSCRSLTRAFMASSSHRGQILGRFRFFAVGAEWRGGRVYVQELFESRRNPGNIYHYP